MTATVENRVVHYHVAMDGNSYALLSNARQVESVIIFVHGFGRHGLGGHPVRTWVDFQGMIDNADAHVGWQLADLIFYSYEGEPQIDVLGARLAAFLERLSEAGLPVSAPPPLPSGHSLRPVRHPRTYRQLTLVGHSTGGLAIRAAVAKIAAGVNERRGSLPQPPVTLKDLTDSERIDHNLSHTLMTSAVRLFSPAQLGAMISGLLGVALNSPLFGGFLRMYLKSIPLYRTLETDSPALAYIARETNKYAKAYPEFHAFRAQSVFGSLDDIVFIGEYEGDPLHLIVEGQTHSSICKPNRNFTFPLGFVLYGDHGRSSARPA